MTRKEPKLIKYQSLKHYDPKKFWEDLINTDWTRILDLKDVHQCSHEWERKFVDLSNKHAPFKYRNVRNTSAPYMENELRGRRCFAEASSKRNILNTEIQMTGPSIRIKNEINVELKNKKQLCFFQKLEHSRGDSKETWKILKSALGSRSKTTNINSLVSAKGNDVTCHNEMANIPSNHFATIADKVLIESERDYHKLGK